MEQLMGQPSHHTPSRTRPPMSDKETGILGCLGKADTDPGELLTWMAAGEQRMRWLYSWLPASTLPGSWVSKPCWASFLLPGCPPA